MALASLSVARRPDNVRKAQYGRRAVLLTPLSGARVADDLLAAAAELPTMERVIRARR